jgi:membrane protease YdiL (CAAX protease family)
MSQYYYNPFGSNDVNYQMQQEMIRKQKEQQEKREIKAVSLTIGMAIIAYLIISQIFVLLLYAFDLNDLYNNNPTFQYSFSIICVTFASVAVPFGLMALYNRKRYTLPVIPNKPLSPLRAWWWVSFGMLLTCIAQSVVSVVISYLQSLFSVEFNSGEDLYPNSIFSSIMCVICLAIMPAICEEFAMRCCTLQLLRKYGNGFAVVAVSIVFGLLHGNVTQFVFAFLIGCVLAFVTVKTDNILPAIFIHMCNNGMSAIQMIVKYAAGENAMIYATVAIRVFWTIVGIVGCVFLVAKGEFVKKRNNCTSVLTTGQKFASFLFPWMIIPFVILIAITFLTITKV